MLPCDTTELLQEPEMDSYAKHDGSNYLLQRI